MSETNCGGKGLTTKLQSLFTELMQSEEEKHIKIDQHQDGHMSFAIYVGDEQVYQSLECYETAGIVLCQDQWLSFRVKESRVDDSEYFVDLAIYDKSDDHLRRYGVELSYQEESGSYIIHDIFEANSLI
ncbi:hypothetical protein [Wolbachia endosymbiont of Folsomia candida]|uniref:hypothetical protein n=1 Tax=Wolbachia endosymbiont of Folsomia candida TaxID=169402 RepID=UPI000B0B1196|nr:hypothetical protein [Wolbachia endosymbiont of Folsomia candida]APR98494.1 hypothetical protein ASM33_04490 [Wolbachia endosymbiont of Folsomia candida]